MKIAEGNSSFNTALRKKKTPMNPFIVAYQLPADD